MRDLIILHTNDLHGRIEGLSRIATLVEQIRAENRDVPVLYFDLGDSEDYSNRLSNLTKGAAMHRLLSAMGCDAAVVGNGAIPRYGPGVLKDHAAASHYPHLLANLRLADDSFIPGTHPTALLDLGPLRLGLIGVTVEMPSYTRFFGLRTVPTTPLIRELAAGLRNEGADAVILLSHLGLATDRELAEELQEDVTLIVGGHSHDLLPEGERVGEVLVTQAGHYAEHLGQINLTWDGKKLRATRTTVLPVEDATPPLARILAEAAAIEAEVERYLDEVIGELIVPLDFATDRECGVANLLADALRQRMDAEVGVLVAGQAFSGPLAAGPLRRATLWDACPSPANPGAITLTGSQLIELVARGLDPERAAEQPRPLRGKARGLMHLSGAVVREGRLFLGSQPVEPEREYRVAGSDFEFEPVWGYTDSDWELHPSYDVPTILREALEEYLAALSPVSVESGRQTLPGGVMG